MVEAALPPTHALKDSDYVRSAELEQLVERYRAAHGGVVVVHGPRGVGKAHLAAELIRRAKQQAGNLVLCGQTPAAGATSFHPFAEIVRHAMTWAEQSGLFDSLIEPLFTDLEPVLRHDDTNDPNVRPSLDQKLRFFEGIRRLFSGLSEHARLLVVLHDIESADADTLELATYLAENLFGDPALEPDIQRPGLFLHLLRDDQVTPPRARDFLARALEHRSITTLRLEGLDLDGLRRYVQSPRVLTRLLEASEGLPSEVDALIDALPSNIQELFLRRLDEMEPSSRALLGALAVFNQPVSARLVAAATGGPVHQVARGLSAHREARILDRHITNGEIRFSFARRANLEATLRSTSREDIARHHAGWARALTSNPNAGGAALLAHHQLHSNEPTRGVPLAIKAAESHTVAGAFDAAAQLLEEALPHARGDLAVTILERLSELSSMRGEPRAAARYVEQWKAAVPDSDLGRVLLREAELFNNAGDYGRALEALATARPLLEAKGPAAMAAIETAATEAHYQLGNVVDAKGTATRGLERLDAVEGEEPADLRIELLNMLGKIALAHDDTSGALEFFRETLVLAQKRALDHAEARAFVNIGVAHMRSDTHEEAEEHLILGIDKGRETNNLERVAFGTLNLGVLSHRRGELGRAIDSYRECKSLFQRLGNRTQLARVLHNLGNLYNQVGDANRARAHNDEALRLAHAGGVERLVAIASTLDGVMRGERGEWDEAEARLREAMVLQRRLGAERPAETMVLLGEVQLRRGHDERAMETLNEAAALLDDVGNRQLSARAELLRGRILLAQRDDRAQVVLTKARDAVRALGERVLLRNAEVALGRVHAAQGKKETARMHLGAAHAIQKAIADELPENLRETFELAPPQREVAEIIDSLDQPTGDLPRMVYAAPRAPVRQAPAPTPRRTDWNSRYGSIIGGSPKLTKVFRILDRVSTSENTVLIVGESGTGKELVAEAIHRNSPRAKGPFVKLNCAALVESLLLSELFGHERGSFTGAHQRKVGRFEMAAGGTIFLDEIGDISPKTQVSLLRVLQEFEFERVGGGHPIKLEARVICATNRNLAQMVRDGTFREDLYYRLRGLNVELPPLRERPEDISALAQHFLAKYAAESGTAEKGLSPDAMQTLVQYRWPGNVRELENVTRSVALFADGNTIVRRDFDEYRELFEDSPALAAALGASRAETPSIPAQPATPRVYAVSLPTEPPPPPQSPDPVDAEAVLIEEIFERGVSLADLKRRIQDEAIAHALRTTKGNITRAADMLGMKRPRLSQIINASEDLKLLCQGVGR